MRPFLATLAAAPPMNWPTLNDRTDRAAAALTKFGAGAHRRVRLAAPEPGHSFLAVSGPVIRLSMGRVAAMIAREAVSPARTMTQYPAPGGRSE